jgi:hypothetical protein
MVAMRVLSLFLVVVSALSWDKPNNTDVIVDEKVLADVLAAVNGVYSDPVKANENDRMVLATAW